MDDAVKRKELGIFIRTRRERLTPEQYGFRSYNQRRAKGLRREEVAMLSGVSLTWYTWLEQGRDIHVSKEVLGSVARTLHFSEDELAYLLELAEENAPVTQKKSDESSITALQQILDSMKEYPAYVLDDRWNTVAWNNPACLIFGDFSKMDEMERNTIWRMFTRAAYRTLFRNWEDLAQTLLAQFRVSYGKNINDAWYQQLVSRLNEASKEFKSWWPDYHIAANKNGLKEVYFSETGTFRLMHNSFTVMGTRGLCMTIYTPSSEEDRTKMLKITSTSNAFISAQSACKSNF